MSEERFTRIENALEHIVEIQMQQTEQVQEVTRMHKSLVIAVSKIAEAQLAMQEEMQRRFADTQKQFDQVQRQLDQLASNIDRFLKGLGPNGKR